MNFIKNQVKEFKENDKVDLILFPNVFTRVIFIIIAGIGGCCSVIGMMKDKESIAICGLAMMLIVATLIIIKAYSYIYQKHIKKQE